MSDSAINAALLGLMAGIGGSLRPYVLALVYWICRRAPPRSRLRRILLGGRGFYYGPIALVLVALLIWNAGTPPQ